MSKLLDKLKKNSTLKHTDVMSSSKFFNDKDPVQTKLPILNLALSGSLKGGLTSGLTTIAAPSAHFKSLLALFMISAYMDKHKDAICLFYDSEFGSPPEYLGNFGIDTSRVFHSPVTTLEDMRTDMVNQFKEINRGDKVIIYIDSLGNLASAKETKDAEDGNDKADFTRAKVIRSTFRIITPQLLLKDIPCVCVNQVYDSMDKYNPHTMGGGNGIRYSSNTVFFISKSQEKDGTELAGYKFTIIANKSRFVKEKSKFPLTVLFDEGINNYSGMLDLALEIGFVEKPSNGWFSRVIDGVVEDKKWRRGESDCDEFWNVLLKSDAFEKACNERYKLSKGDSNSTVDLGELEELEEVDFDVIDIDE